MRDKKKITFLEISLLGPPRSLFSLSETVPDHPIIPLGVLVGVLPLHVASAVPGQVLSDSAESPPPHSGGSVKPPPPPGSQAPDLASVPSSDPRRRGRSQPGVGSLNIRQGQGIPSELPGPGDGSRTLLATDQMHDHGPQLPDAEHGEESMGRLPEEDQPFLQHVANQWFALNSQWHSQMSFLPGSSRRFRRKKNTAQVSTKFSKFQQHPHRHTLSHTQTSTSNKTLYKMEIFKTRKRGTLRSV